jgi:hypothetical protein
MKILASLRVKHASSSSRPAKAEIEHAADVARRHGFDVLRKGRRALTVRAEQADVERMLGAALHAGCFSIAAEHAGSELADAVDMLEMTDAPTEMER